jgi:hypothetical protein
MYSAVARQLPETDEWDLSGLLVDGQPVSRATVVAWLNAAYQHAYDTTYEQQQDSPACSVEGLCRLLAFADAVGSTSPLLRACCAGLQHLRLHAQLGQQQVSLETDGRAYAFVNDKLLEQLDISACYSTVPGVSGAADAQQQAFNQQVAAQTEQLLWLAYRLQLDLLVQRVHGFIRSMCFFSSSLLHNVLDAVFTARVLEAAGVASLRGGKAMLLSSVLGEMAQLTLAEGLSANADSAKFVETWLQPKGLTAQQQKPLKFNAVVKRGGCGWLRAQL